MFRAKNILFLIFACAMISLIAVACSEMTEQPTQSAVIDEPLDGQNDGLVNPTDDFEQSAFDTSLILWDIGNLDDALLNTAAAKSSWSYINDRIHMRAFRDLGRYVGLQCKPWASKVVRDVTGYYLPSTQSNDFYLNPSAHCTRIVDGNVIGGGTIERGLSHGNIIQMKLKTSTYTGPHTAIFVYYTSNGMYWIDSNWYSSQGYPNYVLMHHVSFEWFRRYVGTEYSVYQAWD